MCRLTIPGKLPLWILATLASALALFLTAGIVYASVQVHKPLQATVIVSPQ